MRYRLASLDASEEKFRHFMGLWEQSHDTDRIRFGRDLDNDYTEVNAAGLRPEKSAELLCDGLTQLVWDVLAPGRHRDVRPAHTKELISRSTVVV